MGGDSVHVDAAGNGHIDFHDPRALRYGSGAGVDFGAVDGILRAAPLCLR